MNIVIAIDSFKGCISSMEAGHTLKQAILDKYPDDNIQVFPLADGGEGTVEALTQGLGGRIVPVEVTGPLGKKVKSRYGYIPDTNTAVIEMADASGLPMVPVELRNPLNTTTYGLGELLAAAMKNGCRHFIIGIGGSATNDAGLGMLTALGAKFYKQTGEPCGIYGRDLADIAAMDISGLHPLLKECQIDIACDVTNPLCGPTGCSAIYGPQKGATPEIIEAMDGYIDKFAQLAEKTTGIAGALLPGAGAAGGLGFAFHSFLGGGLMPGIELVVKAINIEGALPAADILITGEGRMDQQTAMGKGPAGIAQSAKKANPHCRTVALCGCATREAELVNQHGIDAYFPILHSAMSLEEAMYTETTKANLTQTIQQVLRLIHY